jgi:hypothetical protein
VRSISLQALPRQLLELLVLRLLAAALAHVFHDLPEGTEDPAWVAGLVIR